MRIKLIKENGISNYVFLLIFGILVFILKKYSFYYFAEINAMEIVLIIFLTVLVILNKNTIIKNNKESNKILLSFIFFISIVFLNFIFRGNSSSLKILLKYLEILYLIFILYLYITSWEEFHNILLGLLVIPASINIITSFYNVFQGETSKLILSPAITFLIYIYIFANKKIYFRLTLIYSLFIALFSSSRGNLLLILILLLIIGFNKVNNNFNKKEKRVMFYIFIILIVIISFFSYDFFVEFFDIGKSTASNNERIRLIKFSLETISDNFWFGIGPGEFTNYWNESPYSFFYTSNLTAHNHFLQIFVEMGIIGFLFFVRFISKIITNQYEKTKYIKTRYRSLVFWLLIIEFYYMFLSPFSGYGRVRFAVITALFLSLNSLEDDLLLKMRSQGE